MSGLEILLAIKLTYLAYIIFIENFIEDF